MADIAEQIRNYGKPTPGQLVAQSQRVVVSTAFIAQDNTITNQTFFNRDVDRYNTLKFPLQETCMDVVGMRITHDLVLDQATPALRDKDLAIFEKFSVLNVKYRQRDQRISIDMATLVGVKNVITANGDLSQSVLSNSTKQDGFFYLPNVLQVGAQQEILFTLDVAPNYKTEANGTLAAESAVNYANSGLAAAGYRISLELLIIEKSDALG